MSELTEIFCQDELYIIWRLYVGVTSNGPYIGTFYMQKGPHEKYTFE